MKYALNFIEVSVIMGLNYAKGTEREKFELAYMAVTAGNQRGSSAGWIRAAGCLAAEPV